MVRLTDMPATARDDLASVDLPKFELGAWTPAMPARASGGASVERRFERTRRQALYLCRA